MLKNVLFKTMTRLILIIQSGLHIPSPNIRVSVHFPVLTFKSYIALSSHTALGFEMLNH